MSRSVPTRTKATAAQPAVLFARGRPVRLAGLASVPLAGWGQAPVFPAGPPPVYLAGLTFSGRDRFGPLVAIRRASSQVSSLAAARLPLFLEIDVGQRLAVVIPASLMRLFRMNHLARLSCGLFRLF